MDTVRTVGVSQIKVFWPDDWLQFAFIFFIFNMLCSPADPGLKTRSKLKTPLKVMVITVILVHS